MVGVLGSVESVDPNRNANPNNNPNSTLILP